MLLDGSRVNRSRVLLGEGRKEYDSICEKIRSTLRDSLKLLKLISDEKNIALLALFYIDHILWGEGLSFKELQASTTMNPSSLSRRLNKLQRHGLIKVEARPDWERRKVYFLTEKGLKIFESSSILDEFSNSLSRFVKQIKEEHIKELVDKYGDHED